MFSIVLISISIICSSALFAEDPVAIHGEITDSETGQPIPEVNIMFTGTRIGTASDADGAFKIENVPPGTYTIQFSHISYMSASYTHTFSPGDDEELRVFLDPRPIFMEEVEVVDTVRGIQRDAQHLFTRDELREAGDQSLGQFLRRNLTRVDIRETGADLFIRLQLRQPAGRESDRRNPLVIVDNIRIGTDPGGLATLVRPSDIQSLEVIRPPESRLLYGNEAQFGAVVIRTVEGIERERGTKLSTTGHFLSLGLLGLVLYFMYR